MKNTVYQITNKKTGQSYIGATSRSPEKRMSEHKSQALRGSSGLLYEAIGEHGWEAFEIKVIQECDSREEMFEREAYFIKEYESNIFGYNISSGYGSTGLKPDHKGQKNPNSRLSEAEVIQIKILLRGDLNQFEIAELYNISHKTVSHINVGRLWSNVNVEFVS